MAQSTGYLDSFDPDHATPNDQGSPKHRFQLDLPSPRVGEIPPALSPLDAFAQQSRLLAKRFELQHNGRRISRLDTLEVASEFGRRPSYFTTSSSGPASARMMRDDDESDNIMPLPHLQFQSPAHSQERPISHYPLFGSANEQGPAPDSLETPTPDGVYETVSLTPSQPDGYFNLPMRRTNSPEPLDGRFNRPGDASPAVPSLSGSIDSLHSSHPRTNTDDSNYPHRQLHSLAPPASPPRPAPKKSLISIRSIMDGGHDEPLKPPRKLSDSSHGQRARSPFTPDPHVTSRSPSIRSEASAAQDDFQRPSFNFSRPLSSSSSKKDVFTHRPSLSQSQTYESKHSSESKHSHESKHSYEPKLSYETNRERSPLQNAAMPFHEAKTPTREVRLPNYDIDRPLDDDSSADAVQTPGGATSYVYSKYSLPRGRTIEQLSLAATGDWNQHQFRWEPQDDLNMDIPTPVSSERTGRPFMHALDLTKARSQSADGRGPPPAMGILHRSNPSTPSVASISTDRTIRAHHRNSPSQDIVNMTAEQHLEKGIECHSSGSLSKSTYHLRHAARAGSPTGMLLYALACRHGWGTRVNQAEGVHWLKKAVDSTSLQFLEDADSVPLPGQQSKGRKAEFALAVYELGMSYMNGWGVSKDKSLAVRCFEVAGSWGDNDALAEAGFCYAQGVGCKKDMKKAAGLYRKAAEGGMNMAGNSWIYKAKYLDEPAGGKTNDGDKAKTGRSRARSLFGRKKSVPAA